MTTILYGVSPIGFGHASRSAAVGLKLRGKGLEPEFATGGPAVAFLRSYGFRVHDVVEEPIPSESGGEMKRASLWYLRYWLGYRSTTKRMAALMDTVRPDLVVGDEEFSCLTLALGRGVKNAMISDELELGFARGPLARRVEAKVSKWYEALQANVSHLLIPSFGEDHGNVHHMTPVVREPTRTRAEVRAEARVPEEGGRMVLFSASGSGIGRYLLERSLSAFERLRSEPDVFVATGIRVPEGRKSHLRDMGVVRDNQDYVAAADLVISTAGKSTVDEARSSGSPLIAIPIRNHAEQERNASALGFSPADLERLDELIPKYLGARTEPARYAGAQRTADYLAALL